MRTTSSTRRSFLGHAVAAAATSLVPRAAWGQRAATLRVNSSTTGSTVPADFVGLSYENMQLEDPTFFSPSNKSLVQQFRAIAPSGVLRLGGNTSEFGWWKAKPSDTAPRRVDSPWKAAGEPTAATIFAITPETIDNLSGFLEATGWRCIYGLNLGYGTPQTDIPEAVYVFNKLGKRLAYFQVGNEVDLFKGHLRDPQTWGVDAYLDQWLILARAVQKALPGARFGMPDVAADVTWLPQIADLWAKVPDKPKILSLSHHYYWSGPPSNPLASIDNLLKRDPKIAADARMSSEAARKMGSTITWRMTEGNTIYRGGKYGVSDVFAAALWSADYLLELMSLGYAGVNLHGGSGHAQAVSVGGVFHGEALMKDPNAPHPKPFYTPIANEGTLSGAGVDGKLNDTYLLEPVAYGMKFAAAFAGATMAPVDFDPGNTNAVSYAARRPDGTTIVGILNKEEDHALHVDCPSCIEIARLSAPSLNSREAHLIESDSSTGKNYTRNIDLPPHTGVLLSLR